MTHKHKRRLIICCDGTWKRSDDPRVSNIEKIARAVAPVAADGTVQLVFSSNGVGTGGLGDRIVGGAFGVGLDDAIIGAYRFLALNYMPDDEIYVFGFSRGAYTARSLVGMIATIGLLKPKAVVDNWLQEAMNVYRTRPREGTTAAIETFKTHTYQGDQAPRINFLGVFDTVGALGAPGITRWRYKFHNVTLTDRVDYARQALAIDERRLTFAPCLWSTKGNNVTDVKQVWFEGVHSDIGGGYKRTAPADLTLRWMVHEAHARGLEFDYGLFAELQQGPLSPNNSLKLAYRVINGIKWLLRPLRPREEVMRFHGDRRLLALRGDDDVTRTLGISRSAFDRWYQDADQRKHLAPNIRWWLDWARDLESQVQDIPPLPGPAQQDGRARDAA